MAVTRLDAREAREVARPESTLRNDRAAVGDLYGSSASIALWIRFSDTG